MKSFLIHSLDKFRRQNFVFRIHASLAFGTMLFVSSASALFVSAVSGADVSIDQSKQLDENIIARVPGLGPIYGARATWAIWRAPFLWTNGELVDVSRVAWPQWDKNQVPISIVPAVSAFRAKLLLETSDGLLLEEIILDKPFLPDRYDPAKKKPDQYRIQVSLLNDRLVLKTRAYPWIQRKNVLECDYEIQQGRDVMADSKVKTCLSSLESVAKNADRQWFATVTWPEAGDAIRRNAMSATDRELKSSFRKSGHVFESQRKGRRFIARAGITYAETVPSIDFDFFSISKFSSIKNAVSREEQKNVMLDVVTAAGGKLIVHSFATDLVEQVAIKSPSGPSPGLHLQFIASKDDAPSIENTEFLESRTGIPGLLRRWRGRGFFNYNQLTSNRGEQNSALGGPGLELSYAMDFWKLEPYLFFDSGLLRPSSTVSISEIQFGARKSFSFLPSWSSVYLGIHQYQLSGDNPGSSRLGASDSISLGLAGIQRIGDHVVQGRAGLLVSTAVGFDAMLEYGKVWHKTSDFHLTWGVFGGVSRYSSIVTVPTNRTSQQFSEDRLSVGISIGFLGPESGNSPEVSASQTPQ